MDGLDTLELLQRSIRRTLRRLEESAQGRDRRRNGPPTHPTLPRLRLIRGGRDTKDGGRP